MSEIVITAVEPEFLSLVIDRNEDGVWMGARLNIEIATVLERTNAASSPHRKVAEVQINLMRSDLETLAEAIDDARVSMRERLDGV